MNDSKNNPKFPPDDFSSTTPNIKMPKQDYQNDSVNDWEKTNYNYNPKDFQQDDKWKKTAYNVPVPQNPPSDYGKTPPNPHSKGDEWGQTQANIKLPDNPNQYDQPSSNRDDYGAKQSEYGQTKAFINLPKNDQKQFEETLPPIEDIKNDDDKPKSGIPGWALATGGMLAMFFFALAVFLGVYLFFLNKKGFDIVVKGVPPRSDVFVNSAVWGVTTAEDGSIRLEGLKAGETKKIDIRTATGVICGTVPQTITGTDGKNEEVIAQCGDGKSTTGPSPSPSPNTTDIPTQCKKENIKPGDFPTATKCANEALDKIEAQEKKGENFTAQQLLDAMNMYIVNFASKDDKIKQSDLAFLQRTSGFLKRLEKLEPGAKIEVGGHTDNVGKDADNQPLSERRAKSVYDSLIGFGVNKDMLTTAGYGAKKPIATNDTPAGKFINRRIEYKKV